MPELSWRYRALREALAVIKCCAPDHSCGAHRRRTSVLASYVDNAWNDLLDHEKTLFSAQTNDKTIADYTVHFVLRTAT